MLSPRLPVVLLLGLILSAAFAQKKPLDHSVYDSWKSIRDVSLTKDGQWIMYTIAPQEGDAVAEVKNLRTSKTYSIDRGNSLRFSNDGHFVLATIVPKVEDVKKAKKDKVKPADAPKNALLILNLDSGEQTKVDRVTYFTLPQEDSGWFAYRPEPPKPEPAKTDTTKPEAAKPEAKKEPATPSKPVKAADDKPGTVLILHQLATGKEERIENVANWEFPKDGTVLAYCLSTKDGTGDGVVWYDILKGRRLTALTAMGRYPRLALQNGEHELAFFTDKDDYTAKKPTLTLYLFDPANQKTELVAKEGTPGLAKGWVPHDGALSFSEKGKRLLFTTWLKPPAEKKDDTPDDEKVSVDVWNWTDPLMMPQQLLEADRERNRGFSAVYNLDSKRVVQLATPQMPEVQIGDKGDGKIALGSSPVPYRMLVSWEGDYADYYVVNVETGEARKALSKSSGGVSLSPDSKYLVGYNEATQHYETIETSNLTVHEIGQDIKFPVYNELNDVPAPAGPYGLAGWTKGDAQALVYDDYDIWVVDPMGRGSSACLTKQYGRNRQTELRYISTDPEQVFVPDSNLLLSAFDRDSKAAGFFRLASYFDAPQKIMMADKFFGAPIKAKSADVIAFTREDIGEFRDLWVSNMSFENPQKISNANPQQASYNWGTAELVRWVSNDGVPLRGVLIKPENFDYTKKYPMIAYFYERLSDNLHRYYSPAPSPSTINPIMFASNGYIVFIPDIPYKIGYPGESAVSAVIPGILSVLQHGYVDRKRIGVQGHSWGGYQAAYLVTATNIFACACAGAPVADMVSAYGGIRWGAGISREFQYEKTQSRIGGTLWDKPLQFLENSPIFSAEKIQTPLLMMANDKDGAVPWYQGIEMFSALRRLAKPAWLVVYNGEDHNLVQRKNRKDWSIRLQQFFDHYLKGAPMPVWMAQGVPATLKGTTLGEELVH